ncbi:MAG TPA: phosphate acyltransferase, partial [bacterium]|nr:phosphate acyltransferase [bacterium]
MNDFIENLRRQAFRLKKRIVLPEGNDPRVVEAAGFLERESGIVPLVLTKENMEKDKKAALARKLLDENSKKGLSEKEAAELSENPLYYGAMLLAEDVVDGFVGGANSTTGDTVRALLKIV